MLCIFQAYYIIMCLKDTWDLTKRKGVVSMALPITESYCIGCGRMYPISNFYKSPNPLHYNKVLPYCKDCCNEMVHKYIKRYGNLESAVWISCATLGVPFVKSIFLGLEDKIRQTDKIGKKYNYMGNYMRVMNTQKKKSDHWEDFADTDVSFGDIETVKKHEESIKNSMQKFVLDWGHHEVDDYQYLEY